MFPYILIHVSLLLTHVYFQETPLTCEYQKLGPNNARCVVWGLGEFFFFFLHFLMLLNNVSMPFRFYLWNKLKGHGRKLENGTGRVRRWKGAKWWNIVWPLGLRHVSSPGWCSFFLPFHPNQHKQTHNQQWQTIAPLCATSQPRQQMCQQTQIRMGGGG